MSKGLHCIILNDKYMESFLMHIFGRYLFVFMYILR